MNDKDDFTDWLIAREECVEMELDDEELRATRKLNGADKPTADKLFKELGYEKIDKKRLKHIQYVRQINKNTKENITFHKTFKKVEVYFYDYEDYEELTKPIAMQELKAINEKVKELGWV